jgi:hypothetical protein
MRKGGTDGALPGLDLDANLQPLGQRVHDVGRVQRRLRVILWTADRREQHALTVNGDFELMLVLQPPNRTQIDLEELDLDHVLPVERERVPGHQAAARPGRECFVLPGLRGVSSNAIRLRPGDDLRIADRECADRRRGGQIALEQHG